MRFCVLVILVIFIFGCVSIRSENVQDRLIQLEKDQEPIWVSMKQLLELKKEGKTFMDITHFQHRPAIAVPQPPSLPDQPQQKSYVRSLIPDLSTTNMQSNVETLSSFRTRFYSTPTGQQAAEFIHSTLTAYSSNRADVTVQFFNSTTTKPQPSVIARIQGVVSNDVVILGSHEDSVHFDSFGVAPGVDDDGSGTVCVLEVFRVLVDSGFKPNRTIEFHFYAHV